LRVKKTEYLELKNSIEQPLRFSVKKIEENSSIRDIGVLWVTPCTKK